jgi:hypothetical protein
MVRIPGTAPSVLGLPFEIRGKIYDVLYDFDDTVEILKTKPLVRTQSAKLHYVCRVFRSEIDAQYYAKNVFYFQNTSALDMWSEKYGERLALMRMANLQAASPLAILDVARESKFERLEELTLNRPRTSTVAETRLDVRRSYQPYPDGLQNWTPHLLYVWRQLELVLEGLPQFQDGTVEWNHGADWTRFYSGSEIKCMRHDRYSVRFRSKNARVVAVPAYKRDWYSWEPIDVAVRIPLPIPNS